MAEWSKLSGVVVSLPIDNIDTDQIIPARFMSVSRDQGYGDYLFYDLRRDEAGELSTNFPLNTEEQVSILIAGKNFGSGSSREAAVYALVDAGIKAVIAPSFGDIFASNAVNNGLLPAQMAAAHIEGLLDGMEKGSHSLSIQLSKGIAELDQEKFPFSIDENWRTKLIKGWDDIDLTLQHAAEIETFKQNRVKETEWAWPNAAN